MRSIHYSRAIQGEVDRISAITDPDERARELFRWIGLHQSVRNFAQKLSAEFLRAKNALDKLQKQVARFEAITGAKRHGEAPPSLN